MRAHGAHASPDEIAELARLIGQAEFPVIFAQHGAGDAQGFAALDRLARDWAIPVCQYWANRLALATDHPMASPADGGPLLARADLVICLDVLAPWMPAAHEPRPDATVVQIGPNPLSQRTPIRNFRADMTLSSDTAAAILALEQALRAYTAGPGVAARFEQVAASNGAARKAALAASGPDDAPGMTKLQIARMVSDALQDDDATIFSELGCPMAPMHLTHAQAWFQEPHAGGLGWSLPAAMGLQLAAPDRLVLATMGDGTYMFANPVACHQIAEALNLPILILVLNNNEWGAVRQSVVGLYPDGYAAKANQVPLTGLSPSPDFTLVAQASRALALRAGDHVEFAEALKKGLDHIRARKGAALIDIRTRP